MSEQHYEEQPDGTVTPVEPVGEREDWGPGPHENHWSKSVTSEHWETAVRSLPLEREAWPTPPTGDHLRLQDFTPEQLDSAALKVAAKLSDDEKRKILNDCGFVTGPNYVRTTGVLYRSLGTQTNVWERDLFALIDAARATHPT